MSAECSAETIPPGYKQTDVGVIPEDWSVETISSVAETSSGTTPSRAMVNRYFRNGHIAWVKTLDLNNSEIFFTEEYVTQAALNETSLKCYPAGCVAVAMYGGYNQIGRTGILRIPATVNQALTVIKPNLRLCSEYLLEVLNFRVDYWKSVASSSRKDPNITGKDIRDFPIALPPIKEQEAISKALYDADALIESLEQLIAKKRKIKQGAMQELLTGKRRLPGFETKRGYKQTEVGVVPEDWLAKTIGELCSCFSGGTPSTSNPRYYGGSIAWITSSDLNSVRIKEVKGRITDEGLANSAAKIVREGTLLLALYGATAGVSAVTEIQAAINQAVLAILPKWLDTEYLFQLFQLQKDSYIKTFTQGGQPNFSGEIVKSFLISFPPTKTEQTAIATILSDMDSEIATLEEKLAKAHQIKQGMMQELLTGRIRLI
jgi:type I restriction enzyme S subunit